MSEKTITARPYGALDTAKFSYNFISDNFSYFIHILKPLLPVMFISTWLAGAMETGEHADNPLSLSVLVFITGIAAIFYNVAFAIMWHRTIILGASDTHKVNPLKLKKSEWGFLLMGFVVVLILAAIGGLGGLILSVIGSITTPVLAVIGGIALFIAMIIYATRLYLYFPAKAAGADITLMGALKLGKGVTGKLIGALLLSAIPVIVMAFVIMTVAVLVLSLIMGTPDSTTSHLVFSLFITPLKLFISLIGMAAGIGVLSRYYMWAVQEKMA